MYVECLLPQIEVCDLILVLCVVYVAVSLLKRINKNSVPSNGFSVVSPSVRQSQLWQSKIKCRLFELNML